MVNSANFYFESDDKETHGEIMMTLQVGTQVHPITVISMPGKDKVTKATTCLVDQCCTGSSMITSAFAKILGIGSTPTTPREFSMANGTLATSTEVNIEGAKLPGLSKRREFKLTLQIVPDTVSLNYGIVLGLKTMKQINLNTSVRNKTISWSDELSTPVVPQSFWSKERMAKLIESTSHKESNDLNNGHKDPNDTNSDGDLTNSELFATEFNPNDYEKPDLTAVVAKNLTYSPTQRANARVECLMILLNEEFGVRIEHIKGEDNTGGDGLSRLAFLDTASKTVTIFAIHDMDRDKNHMFPLDMHQILKEQVMDKKLQEKLKDEKK
jgi:hypothetical protein